MNQKYSVGWPGSVLVACIIGTLAGSPSAQSREIGEPIRYTLTFEGVEREYFVQLPPTFDRHSRRP